MRNVLYSLTYLVEVDVLCKMPELRSPDLKGSHLISRIVMRGTGCSIAGISGSVGELDRVPSTQPQIIRSPLLHVTEQTAT